MPSRDGSQAIAFEASQGMQLTVRRWVSLWIARHCRNPIHIEPLRPIFRRMEAAQSVSASVLDIALPYRKLKIDAPPWPNPEGMILMPLGSRAIEADVDARVGEFLL